MLLLFASLSTTNESQHLSPWLLILAVCVWLAQFSPLNGGHRQVFFSLDAGALLGNDNFIILG